ECTPKASADRSGPNELHSRRAGRVTFFLSRTPQLGAKGGGREKMSERQETDWTTPRLHSRHSSPAGAAGETMCHETPYCGPGQVQRLVRQPIRPPGTH